MAKTKVTEKEAVETLSNFFDWRFWFMLVIFMAFLLGTIQVIQHYDRAWKAADYALMTPYGQCLQECAAVGDGDLCVEECRAYIIKDTNINTHMEVTSFFRAPPTTSTTYQPQEILAGHTIYNCDDNTNICEKINITTTQTEQPSINIITDAPKTSESIPTINKIIIGVGCILALLIIGIICWKLDAY